ncbi:hypothetical protein Syun_001938 [Stephania yunnanensis]|uniref:Uncharacterized protein n=1 Tax=Stephania yunnanensis TaxID=152371 RepID=A0AAP0LEP2_9MAGN
MIFGISDSKTSISWILTHFAVRDRKKRLNSLIATQTGFGRSSLNAIGINRCMNI